MKKPDQRQFEADLQSAEYRCGLLKGIWAVENADALAWPKVVLWLAAAPRGGAPDRFPVALDCEGYRAAAPTGNFWDLVENALLAAGKRPKGKPNSRVAKVFRTDWEGGRAFYHPYDRVAVRTHPQWVREQPHLIWHDKRTIVDWLEEFHALLRSGDYVGI